MVEVLNVEWPSGAVGSWKSQAADRLLEIVEGRPGTTGDSFEIKTVPRPTLGPLIHSELRRQYASALMTSPPLRVERDWKTPENWPFKLYDPL